MDPNDNTVPTPNPAPGVPPVDAPNPAPAEPAPMGDAPAEAPVNPLAEPQPVNPAPVNPAPVNPAPVNPVIGPNPAPVNPVFQPSSERVAATDPIMRPEPAPEPDPIEEELKAPMKAAGPAPGSIGSAVSGPQGPAPADAGSTPSVAFNDPATQPDATNPMAEAGKKKSNRTTLIVLIIVAAVVVVALAAVLLWQFVNPPAPSGSGSGSGNSSQSNSSSNSSNSSSSSNSSNSSSSTTEEEEEAESTTPATPVAMKTMTCTRSLTAEELAALPNAASGTIEVTAKFDTEDVLDTIAVVKTVNYTDAEVDTEEETHEAVADEITADNSALYYLQAGADGTFKFNLTDLNTNYTNLAFTCEVL